MELLHLTTSDNIKLAGNYFPVSPSKQLSRNGWVVFLHMMPATKESWTILASQLQQEGYAGLAIDLRGHGISDGGPKGYTQFSDAEHQDSVRDVDAAIDFLTGLGARPEQIIFIGASIGANLALQYVYQHRAFKKAILLSPGFNYHGIAVQPIVSQMPSDKQLFYIASEDDVDTTNSAEVESLYALTSCAIKQKEIVADGGHGSAILTHHPELIDEIITFIKQ
ncbi:MAG: hypothetical protein ACD_81C00126G0008 [uncultured bacterium]|uniref:Serine aminopeptidase S33 domain-containing protein n=2 Tax=Candidatus Wolfeibacteriota TaxID=1752735 RepID=A0A0G1HBB1_9BACT|nr:MAG: hypothetical protein ACD_81C00126G0008 [uncultured bacterium]KKR12887.1 MAG: hypothetical protein UT41_C0001G0431 [Candidatus Wolfebacteria bacterium GW2011_GWC2_39_22]KKT43818.1 MAG: hypothetical protein UW32_C0001G0410 [Candidatus Wolfebacteria bacterium GW2011_GWE2_44_13]HBI25453.1 hypothetical protein [Candidatus Wolfebacteria bacterium]